MTSGTIINKQTNTNPSAEAGGIRCRCTQGVYASSQLLGIDHSTKTMQKQQQFTETLMVLMACQEEMVRYLVLGLQNVYFYKVTISGSVKVFPDALLELQ